MDKDLQAPKVNVPSQSTSSSKEDSKKDPQKISDLVEKAIKRPMDPMNVACRICNKKLVMSRYDATHYNATDENPIIDYCHECLPKFRASRLKEFSKKNEALERIGVPLLFQKASVDDFPPALIDKLPDKIEPPGLLITGQPSIGKTHMAAALARRELQHHIDIDKGSINACWVNTHELLTEIRDTFNKKRNETEAELLKKYVQFSFLVLDDLGCEKNSEWAMATICNIIDNRINLEHVTLITSNFDISGIAANMDSRIAARLMSYVTVKYKGRDRRKEKGKLIDLSK